MKLKTIKSKTENVKYNELILKTIELIKDILHLNLEENHIFFLTWFNFRIFFLYKNTVILVSVKYEYDSNNKPKYNTAWLDELYTIKLLKNYPKTDNDIEFKTIINNTDTNWFKPETFLNWIDEPSEINEEIDEPYYKVISYLQNYNKTVFSTDRYGFYSKWDNDQSFIMNIFAYDKKNKAELKLYIPDKCENIDDNWQWVIPKSANDVVVDDLSNKLSNYQKLQCKKAFLKLVNQENEYFKAKNFWVMELVKLMIQPIDILHEWSCHRCFCDIDLFGAIWVHDFLDKNEEPYFFITDSAYLGDTTKIAVLDFKNPKYHTKGIFKKGNVKRKGWKLNKTQIKELIKFLNAPSKEIDSRIGYEKYVKTNWQQLIFEYNSNTAGWGWGSAYFDILPQEDNTEHEALPFDLPIPDYMELFNDDK